MEVTVDDTSSRSVLVRDPHRDALRGAIAAERGRKDRRLPEGGPDSVPAFVTISREAGVDAHAVGNTLAALLNARRASGAQWVVWDRHSLEAAVQDDALCDSIDRSLSESSSTWYRRFSSGLGIGAAGKEPVEFLRQRRLALLVRTLARAGRAIIIGCAGVYATQDLRGGVHVRLVAPLPQRVANITAAMDLTEAEAAAELGSVDRKRAATHCRFCSGRPLRPDYFTITLNVARVPTTRAAACLLLLIPNSDGGGGLPAMPAAIAREAIQGTLHSGAMASLVAR